MTRGRAPRPESLCQGDPALLAWLERQRALQGSAPQPGARCETATLPGWESARGRYTPSTAGEFLAEMQEFCRSGEHCQCHADGRRCCTCGASGRRP